MQILLVEPDAILGKVYQKSLATLGTVAWAKTAQSAISLADETTPDIVVLEPKLAAHNGIEFLYEFKSYAEWREVPVVVHSSGSGLIVPKNACRDLRIVACLDKRELSLQDLCSSVQSAFEAAVR